MKSGASIKSRPRHLIDLAMRPPVLVSLGTNVVGAALPHPDPQDPDTIEAGARSRFARTTPVPDPVILGLFKIFVKDWIEKNLVPLSPDSDTTILSWLENTNYPLWRKEELMKKYEEMGNIRDSSKKYFNCKSFMKDECYPEYKHARGINSRSDEFKCVVGPFFKLIENEVYRHPAFIKHVPVADRPSYIHNMLFTQGGFYTVTDYTAFESHFSKEIMEACEFQLYEYMTRFLPRGTEFINLVRDVIAGENVCEFKYFTVKLPATRMSGEMNTSLGNGFSNLMVMLFVFGQGGCTNVRGVVEGDDGLFTAIGSPPNQKDFEKLGFTIKLEVKYNLNEASFCGLIFDVEDLINITDPIKELLSFGWTSARYARCRTTTLRKLLRCKALSLAHQYPGSPIVSALARYGLRVTRSFNVKHFVMNDRGFSMWNRDRMLLWLKNERKIPVRETGIRTRFLVETMYGIRIEHQVMIERYLDSLDSIIQLDDPIINLYVPQLYRNYFVRYSFIISCNDKLLNYPVVNSGKLMGFVKEW